MLAEPPPFRQGHRGGLLRRSVGLVRDSIMSGEPPPTPSPFEWSTIGAHPDDRAERLERARRQLGHMAWLLDSSFRVPGTRFRFGLEPIIGLVPGAGDVVSGALGFYLVLRALQFRLPLVVVLRMVANTVLDLIIGAVPLLGDLFDFAYKSNRRNMELFDRYASDPGADTRSQWAFLAGVVAVAVGGLFLVAWLIEQVLQAIARDLA